VDFGTTYQTIRGFGGSEAWSGVMPQSQINTLYGNGTGDLGLTIMRLRIAPATWNSANNMADTTQWAAELTNGLAAQALGASIFATPWTPPASMKSDNSIYTGSLNASSYGAYASYLEAYVNYATSIGVNLYGISMQNEPDWDPCGGGGPTAASCYESCLWTGAQMDTWVAGNASTLTTRLIMPESFNFDFGQSDPTLNDANAAPLVSIVGGHLYGASPAYYTLAENLKKDLWMTEHTVNLASGETTTQSMTDALNAATEIHNSMVTGQFNAYVYWWLVNSVGNGYYSGLLDTSGVPTYFGDAVAQFSRFVRPGYVRANAAATPVSGVYVSAYTGNGHYVIVAVNTNASSESLNFQISNATVSSMTPYQTTSSSAVAQQSAVTVAGDAFVYALPAASITTFVQ
jgi:glucuronoarabinoxylan endo-1,4-beta-xylanase